MTATALPPRDRTPPPAPPDPALEGIRQECRSLRAQLAELARRLDLLERQLGQRDALSAAPSPDGPPLQDLIAALVRGADGPRSEMETPSDERDLVPGLRWSWVALALAVVLAVVLLFHLGS